VLGATAGGAPAVFASDVVLGATAGGASAVLPSNFVFGATTGAPPAGNIVMGRFDSLMPQITSAYSLIVRSVENLAIDVAASMLSLHQRCLSAYVASTLF